jgi:hypothetical protein
MKNKFRVEDLTAEGVGWCVTIIGGDGIGDIIEEKLTKGGAIAAAKRANNGGIADRWDRLAYDYACGYSD